MPNPSRRTWHFHRLLNSDCQIRAGLGTFIACSARIAKSEPPDLAIRRERESDESAKGVIRLGLPNPSRRTWHFHRLLNSDCQIRAAGLGTFIACSTRIAKSEPPDLAIRLER
ncbi:hypothetical protein QUF72_20685 [Desulfobacterales bacterium HSG2]|nr:hypothetical protein [Desulfobacterales bacterium HSG2]